MTTDFKVGDKCYFEFEEVTIKEMNDKHITCVSYGYGAVSGHLTPFCFPATDHVRNASELASKNYHEIRRQEFNALNYPDIKNFITAQWTKMCKEPSLNTEPYTVACSTIECFSAGVIHAIDEMKRKTVMNIRILR